MKNALEVSHLTKDYGSFKLDDVSFTVPETLNTVSWATPLPMNTVLRSSTNSAFIFISQVVFIL